MSKQLFKAIHFPDYCESNRPDKVFSISFSEKEMELFKAVSQMSTYQIQEILGTTSFAEIKQQANREYRNVGQYIKYKLSQALSLTPSLISRIQTKDVTFSNSLSIPFQRWYPYIEGYSPQFVTSLIEDYCTGASLIYDPFAGTGTTLFACEAKGIDTVYSEVNPLLRFLIKTKLSVMTMSETDRESISAEFRSIGHNIIGIAKKHRPSAKLQKSYNDVFGESIYFPEDQLNLVLRLRTYIDSIYKSGNEILGDLLSVAVFSILLSVSYLKKQGDVRFKTEKEKETEMRNICVILPEKIESMCDDLDNFDCKILHKHQLLANDAKCLDAASIDRKISHVITSPPYLNGTNYFRNTKLELWFLGYIKKETDLRSFRDAALTSGINDVKKEYRSYKNEFDSQLLDETLSELNQTAYDKRIPLMVNSYFHEMYQVFKGLSTKLEDGATLLIDLGDSIFSGTHIKTDYILSETLSNLGYTLQDRIVLRQRRSRNGSLLSQVLLVYKYQIQQDE